jgi:hypothetical protein
MWDNETLVRPKVSIAGYLSSGVRFSTNTSRAKKLLRVRFGVDALRAARWSNGDRIGMKWSRERRKFLFYRKSLSSVKGVEMLYALKKFNPSDTSAASIEINPATLAQFPDILAILSDLCDRGAEPEWSLCSDGLEVSMVVQEGKA